MKKLIRRIPVVKKYIDIVLDIYDYDEEYGVAASELLKDLRTFQPPIKKKLKMSDEAFGLYTNFIQSVIGIIQKNRIPIKKHYQSKKSYAYYIYVEQLVGARNKEVKYQIIFRINNHINRSFKRGEMNDKNIKYTPVYKDIRIGDYKSNSRVLVMDYLDGICKGIHDKDPEAFTDEFKVFE